MARRTQNTDKLTPELLTVDEAAVYLNVSPRWVLRARYEGRLPYVKLGHFIRFRRADLDAVIEANTRGGV